MFHFNDYRRKGNTGGVNRFNALLLNVRVDSETGTPRQDLGPRPLKA